MHAPRRVRIQNKSILYCPKSSHFRRILHQRAWIHLGLSPEFQVKNYPPPPPTEVSESRYTNNQCVPGWTTFNEMVSTGSPVQPSVIGYFPVINASPTQHNTVYIH